ncbi:hypothetical protein O3M35_010390 [Rhynocoris fuscipes]|uniref:Uncharacterized protein n=1 Tax=Rhynocoris fuscipes TaxID=488301 RepID=A0AAW1CZP7_9HEMI
MISKKRKKKKLEKKDSKLSIDCEENQSSKEEDVKSYKISKKSKKKNLEKKDSKLSIDSKENQSFKKKSKSQKSISYKASKSKMNKLKKRSKKEELKSCADKGKIFARMTIKSECSIIEYKPTSESEHSKHLSSDNKKESVSCKIVKHLLDKSCQSKLYDFTSTNSELGTQTGKSLNWLEESRECENNKNELEEKKIVNKAVNTSEISIKNYEKQKIILSNENVIQNIYAERNKQLLNNLCGDQMIITNKNERTKLINVIDISRQKNEKIVTNLADKQTVRCSIKTGKNESFLFIESSYKEKDINEVKEKINMCDCKLKYSEVESKFQSDDVHNKRNNNYDLSLTQNTTDNTTNDGNFKNNDNNFTDLIALSKYSLNEYNDEVSKEDNKIYFNEKSALQKTDYLQNNENSDGSENLVGKFASTLSNVWESTSDKKVYIENFKSITDKNDKIKEFVMNTVDNVSKQLLNHDSSSTLKSFYIENSSKMFDILKPMDVSDGNFTGFPKKSNKRVTMKSCPFLELKSDLLTGYTEAELQNFRKLPNRFDSVGFRAEEVYSQNDKKSSFFWNH